MANTIKLRRSAVQGAVPSTAQLALGELAINTYDGKLFLKKDTGVESIVEVGAGALPYVENKTQQALHGFVNRTGSSISATPFDDATRTFTLTKVTDYTVYVGGVPITITTNLTCQIGTGLGTHFIWMTAAGTLATSQTSWSLTDTTIIPVVVVYWDGTKGLVGEERHSAYRNLEFHSLLHSAWGSQYISGFTSSPTFAAGAGNTFSFVSGIIADEDIRNNSGTLDSGGSPHTNCRIAYRAAGGASLLFDARGPAYAKVSGGLPQYDNAGTLTALGNGNYGIYWIYATNFIGTPIVSIVGQGTYASVADAQAAPYPTLPIAVAEWKLLYRVIVRQSAGAMAYTQTDVMYGISSGPAIQPGSNATVVATNVVYSPTGNLAASNVQAALDELDAEKQATLVSGTNIKTINSTSLLGSGDIAIAPMVYPGAGIAVSTGSAWGTSLTAPSGALVGTTDTQTLTNKKFSDNVLIGTDTNASNFRLVVNSGTGDNVAGFYKTVSGENYGITVTCSTGTSNTPTLSSNTTALGFGVAGSTRMVLDSYGHLNLGASPEAWPNNNIKVIQINVAGAIAAFDSGGMDLYSNARYDGAGNFYYRISGQQAARFTSSNIVGWVWQVAPSGTAGNTITWTTHMSLDLSGNLKVNSLAASKAVFTDSTQKLTTTGTLGVDQGGTGATTASDARTNLGLGTAATMTGPSGTIVGTTDTQTLTNKTLTDPTIVGAITEDVFTITDGAAFEINPGNGTIQLITLGASRTPKGTSFVAGESVTLMVQDGAAYTLTWTDATWGGAGVVWKTDGGSAPQLNTTGYTTIVLWKVGSQVYGARVGNA